MAGQRYGKHGKYSATEWKRLGYDKNPFVDILTIIIESFYKMSFGIIALIFRLFISLFKFVIFDWWWCILKAIFRRK